MSTTTKTAPSFPQLLTAYANAVAKRVYWERNGYRGDGNLEAARAVEKRARAAVIAAQKAGHHGD